MQNKRRKYDEKKEKIIGNVLSTDIVTFIDRTPIRSYNYQNHTYVIAEKLRDYGFDVA